MELKNENIQNGLLVISGKEHGRLFVIQNGIVEEFDHLEEHPPEYSDNEGFFIRSGDGERYGSGNPREVDDKRNLDRYLNALESEIRAVIKVVQPEALFITEPQHLKGKIEQTVSRYTNTPIHTVALGNYVESNSEKLQSLLEGFNTDNTDPANPASVSGEENAEEKRKILETGQMLDNQ